MNSVSEVEILDTTTTLLTFVFRFSRFLFFAFHFLTFSIKLGSGRCIISKVILLCLMRCKCFSVCFHLPVEIFANLLRIMFTREFAVIDSAVSAEQLRMRLKDNELEQYGESVTPEYVYEVINRLPRFSTMRVSTCPNLQRNHSR